MRSAMDGRKPVVYCSGALFCPAEVRDMERIARALEEAGFETFLPHRDGLEAFIMKPVNRTLTGLFMLTPAARWVNRAAFALDIYQVVERCGCFVVNMNGRVPDEGAVVETAAALGTGKPVVMYASDPEGWTRDPVLIGASSTFTVVDAVGRIPEAVERAAAGAPGRGAAPPSTDELPPRVKAAVRLGGAVWRSRWLYRFAKPRNELAS